MAAKQGFNSVLSKVDPEIRTVVEDLLLNGYETFASCSGLPGHLFRSPAVRCHPCDPSALFNDLMRLGYRGFYVKQYLSSFKKAPVVDFVEVEFWSPDCTVKETLTTERKLKIGNIETRKQVSAINYLWGCLRDDRMEWTYRLRLFWSGLKQ